jgi:HAD superfamily hydrolase (TIGR01509 family)
VVGVSGGLRGVLFDLDGTLVDTEPLQWEAYRRALAPFGVDVGIDEYRRHWIAVEGGAEYACRTYRLPIDAAALRASKSQHYRRVITEAVSPRPGAAAALERLRGDYAIALATNSVHAEVAVVLDRSGLASLVPVVIAREDYAHAKPAPDAYVAAAAALGLPTSVCAVVEDTTRGVRAGLAAGATVIAVPNELTVDNDFHGVACRLDSLDELSPALLQDLSRAR